MVAQRGALGLQLRDLGRVAALLYALTCRGVSVVNFREGSA